MTISEIRRALGDDDLLESEAFGNYLFSNAMSAIEDEDDDYFDPLDPETFD